MKKGNYTTRDGKIVKGIVTKSTMPNTSKKRIRHKKDAPRETTYKVKFNIIPTLGCVVCVFGYWDPEPIWTIMRISLFFMYLSVAFKIEKVEK